MKAVLQVVKNLSLTIEGNVYSAIDKGMLVLLGVSEDDSPADADVLAKKIVPLRIFDDEKGKTNLSCLDDAVDGEFMIVSNFTLCADLSHGRRPDYFKAAKPDRAKELYEYFIERVNIETKSFSSKNKQAKTGVFGADMKISFTNDGPMTFVIDSKQL